MKINSAISRHKLFPHSLGITQKHLNHSNITPSTKCLGNTHHLHHWIAESGMFVWCLSKKSASLETP